MQEGAKQRPHRRVLTPQAWTLSVDTTGPFVKAQDENLKAARYLVVGVLTVPKILATPPKRDEDGPPDEDRVEDPPEDPVDEAELLEAAEWLADDTADDAVVKDAWKRWSELVDEDGVAWKKEAQLHHLPKMEMVDWTFVEPVATKSSGEVLNAVGRMFAMARSEGFDVRRIHADRGREFMNSQMRTWCARHGLHKTYSVAEEHQGNGRVEGSIQRVKSKVRTILREASCGPEEWPLASRLAARKLKHLSRTTPKCRFCSVPGTGGVWESLTVAARTKGPSGDTTRGWIVKQMTASC